MAGRPLRGVLAAVLPAAAAEWVRMPKWFALPSGDHSSVSGLAACQDLAAGSSAAIFSFNPHTNHCTLSNATVLGGTPSDHVISGCVASRVKYCRPSPGPAILPKWTAPKPDNKKPLGGYPVFNASFTALVHRGDKVLGSYNHNVMFNFDVVNGFFAQWKNCMTDEDCNGQRMLYSVSPDGQVWAPARVLFPNMSTEAQAAALEPGPPVSIHGRLYAATSPGTYSPGNKHDQDAQGSQFCLWPDPLNPRNCGPPTPVAIQYTDTLLLRRVLPGDAGLGAMFWASEQGPELFAGATAALGIKTLREMDATTQADIDGLHNGDPAAFVPPCEGTAAETGTLKCEGCRGGCQTYRDIDFSLGMANERSFYKGAPQLGTDFILYRNGPHHQLYASTRNASSSSQDDWSLVAATDIPNDQSNLNTGVLPDGRRYLVHNPVTPAKSNGNSPSGRDPVTVATSATGADFSQAGVAMTCTALDNVTGCEPRYPGKSKNAGPSYPQALTVVDPAPAALHGLYVLASVNKEDIWIAKLDYGAF